MMRTLFLRACRLRGAEDFFVDPGERVSGHAAQDGALKLAAGLAAQGIACGDRVALLCRSSVRHALAYFACLVRGAVACNLHVREAPQRLAETLAWLDAKLMLYDADLEPLARDIAAAGGGCASLALDAAGIARLQAAGRFDPQRAPLAPEALAAIVLSSGTTGRPNGVMHSQATLAENARGAQPCYLGITPHDSTLVLMNPSFAAWPNIVLGHVGAAAKTVFAANFAPQGFLETLARERVTMAPLVPTMWRLVLDEDIAAHDLSCLRLATISGEPPAQRDLERIVAATGARIASLYLSSEGGCGCGVLATNADLMGRGKFASTGKPVIGADLRVVAPEGGIDELLPAGAVGEIAVSGPSLALGYWKDPERTRARFVDGWWRSGDMGFVDEDGDLFITGRTDNLINSGGIKVHAEEIERALLAHPEVVQAAVVGQPDTRWGQRIEAYVVLRGAVLPPEALETHCRRAGLAGFKLPKVFHHVASLPTGPTGKLYRRALRTPGADFQES